MAKTEITASKMKVEFGIKPDPSMYISKEKVREVIKEVVKVETVYITKELTASVTLEHAAPDGSPFPEALPGPAPDGLVSGGNGLVRNQYNNGQALTAALLQREQRYHDARARVVAQAFPAGVVWGLGLRVQGRHAALGTLPSSGTAVDLDADTVLGAGLAFDGAGRPIAVGGDFSFPFRRLLQAAAVRPMEVVIGPTGFQPCVCLRPSSTAAASGADRSGPWLLVIGPEEQPQGEAKVYGARTQVPIGCVADGWRGGFGLSLARLPLDGASLGATDVWSLRGALVAWLFDTYERDLGDRWAGASAAREEPLVEPPLASAVPLALVYLAADGSVLFCDRWAPRRPLVESAPAAAGRAALGAETSSRALARRRQFQGMLAESLEVLPMDLGGAPSRSQDLYSRGFRHLPPAGVLPVPIVLGTSQDPLAQARDVLKAATAYFHGTNVVLGEEIALSEDMLHAEIEAASELDPIKLMPAVAASGGTSLEPWVQQPSLRRFGQAILARQLTLEQLTRGQVVLVRLIAALHPEAAGVGPRLQVAFARQPLNLALDLPPPPPAPTVTGAGSTLAIRIDSPEEGKALWVGDRLEARWTLSGGTGPVSFSATLAGATSPLAVTQRGLPATQTFSLIVGADGLSGSLVVPDANFAGPTTLTVTARDSAAEQSATRSLIVRKRSVSLTLPAESAPFANTNRISLRWEVAEGWSLSFIDISASFEGIEANQSDWDPFTREVVVGGEPVKFSKDVALALSGSLRQYEVSLTALLGEDNHLVGQLKFMVRARDSDGNATTASVAVRLDEPGSITDSDGTLNGGSWLSGRTIFKRVP